MTEAQVTQAGAAAGAMGTFDTWLAASDRKNEHILVSDDGDITRLRLAYIEYSFSLSYEWIGVAAPAGEPRAAFPSDVQADTAAVAALGATLLLALGSWSVVEKSALRLKHHALYKHTVGTLGHERLS